MELWLVYVLGIGGLLGGVCLLIACTCFGTLVWFATDSCSCCDVEEALLPTVAAVAAGPLLRYPGNRQEPADPAAIIGKSRAAEILPVLLPLGLAHCAAQLLDGDFATVEQLRGATADDFVERAQLDNDDATTLYEHFHHANAPLAEIVNFDDHGSVPLAEVIDC